MKRILLSLLLIATPAGAQSPPIIYGDTVVEILGLKKWTPTEVEAAVRRYAPHLTLASAACAVILRDSVGFSDAAVISYEVGDTVWTTIRVVEPSDSGLVRYTANAREEIELPERWEKLDSTLSRNPRLVNYFQNPDFLLAGADSINGRPVPPEGLQARMSLAELATEADYAMALHILKHASPTRARQAAALVATNFPKRDATWHALVEAFRAGSDQGSALAQMSLRAMSRSGRFVVNWTEAGDALEAVMGGTNLFGYDILLSALVDTNVDPALARRLTQVNAELLVDHATARARFVRGPALRFLEHAGVSAENLGREELLAWIRAQ